MSPLAHDPVLSVHEFGRREPGAPTLVLFHGITDSGLCWGDAVARWQARYRILAVDALGHGQSPRFTAEQLAAEPGEAMYEAAVAAVEEHTDRSNLPVLIGHSMGGATATAIVARRPDLVRGAVMEDPAWTPPDEPRDHARLVASWLREHDLAIASLDRSVAECRRRSPRWPEAELQPWARAKTETDRAFLEQGAVFVREPWPDLVRRIERPVLVVTGTVDTIIGASRPIVDSIANPNVEIAVVEGAGHCVRRDRGNAFHTIVDAWLGKVFARESVGART